MNIFTYSLGELQANCYLIEHDGEAILIDPADDGGFLLEELLRKNLHLVGLLATHGHFDHVMAVGEMQLSFDVPLYLHQKDTFLIQRLTETAEHFLEHRQAIIPPKHFEFISSSELEIGNCKLQIIHTPGHTPGSVSYYFPDEKIIFTGDTLFRGAVGRTDFSYGDKKALRESLQKLFTLPDEVEVYPGHGESTFIQEEKKRVT